MNETPSMNGNIQSNLTLYIQKKELDNVTLSGRKRFVHYFVRDKLVTVLVTVSWSERNFSSGCNGFSKTGSAKMETSLKLYYNVIFEFPH